jgi:glyoxylase-like metal-dependent hydrolase (beta-lactamase superfamily II)
MHIALLIVLLAPLGSTFLAAGTSAISVPNDNSLERESVLGGRRWIHGSSDCAGNLDPAIDVYAHDQTTYILRQNKCLTFEAPFIYVLVGENKILILDTGAIEDQSDFSLYQTVRSVLGQEAIETKEILVVHSHSHSDHYMGDAQLKGKPKVTLVKPTGDDVRSFFGFKEWPNSQASVELGGRTLIVIPTPGHQEEAITIYDPQTKWLLTGDTLYPGYIYVKNWGDYKSSIARLALFSVSHEVSALLGSHIEMTREPGKYYPIGTMFQPDEAALDLVPESLRRLSNELQGSDEKKVLVFDRFIVAPMNAFQRALSNLARWITQ